MILETLFIGLVLALFWAEVTDVAPGGLVVAGYFALYIDRPLRVAATLAAALLALALYKFLAGHLVLFGRRRFVLLVLAGAVLSQAGLLLLPKVFGAPVELRVIGWVVPGILASSLVRQKALPTLASLAAVSTLTFAVVRLAGSL
jgi:poly-gamma-glutamate biosynthesis protein PgsC/CapC